MFGLEAIGKAGKDRRKAMGLTQEEVANRSGIHRNDVSAIERGRYTGSVLKVASYLQTLGMELQAGHRNRPVLGENVSWD